MANRLQRLSYIDNLRTLLIALVVFYHGIQAYTVQFSDVIGWYVINPHSKLFDVLSIAGDLFLFSILFFIAGFFAVPSLKRLHLKGFVREKIYRLLLPLLLGSLLLNPYPNYVQALTEQGLPYGYWHFWWHDYVMHYFNYLEHSKVSVHLWFLSLLFALFMSVLALYMLKPKWLFKQRDITHPWRGVVCFTAIMWVIFAGVDLSLQDLPPTYTIGYLWTGQPSRIPLYILFFAFGMDSYRNHWLEQWQPRLWPLVLITAVLTSMTLYFSIHFYAQLAIFPQWVILNALLFVLTSVLLLLTLLKLAQYFFNQTTPILRLLAENSYAIYLLHFNVVLYCQLWLLQKNWSAYWKSVLIFLVSYSVCLCLSASILRWLPLIRRMLYQEHKKKPTN